MCHGRDIPSRGDDERDGLHIVRVNKALPATGNSPQVAGTHRIFAAYHQERDVFQAMPEENAGSMPEEKNEDDDRYGYAKQPHENSTTHIFPSVVSSHGRNVTGSDSFPQAASGRHGLLILG
jgi:hypothetical protein